MTLAVDLSDALGLTSDKVTTYMELWTMFIVLLVVILVFKSIYNRFRVDHEG